MIGYRLSPQQRRVWELQQQGGSDVYQTQCQVTISGALDEEALKRALNLLVKRHEILRTTFNRLEEMELPLQVIGQEAGYRLREEGLEGEGEDRRERRIREIYEEEWREGFDLERGPVLAIVLIRENERKSRMILRAPAMCSDAMGMENLVRELSECYREALSGETGDGEEIERLQYADLAEWQNGLFESEDAAPGIEFWRRQEIFPLQSHSLAFEKNRMERTPFNPATLTFGLSSECLANIKRWAEQNKTSLSAFFLSCWQVLLWRMTSNPAIVVGIAADGHNYSELEHTTGLLARYVPIDDRLDKERSFIDLVSATSKSLQDALQWQECFTWDEIADQALPGSFFPFTFKFQQRPREYKATEISFSIDQRDCYFDRFKVELGCTEQDAMLLVELRYDSNLIERGEIELLGTYYQTLLDSIIAQCDSNIGDLSLAGEAQLQYLVSEFNDSDFEYPKDHCIQTMFERQVVPHEDCAAIVFEEYHLTYGDLNRRANRLARHLNRLGVEPEGRVGLLVERSPDLLVGMLGILKAGGAYVPFDPVWPKARITSLLADASVQILVTQESLLAGLDPGRARPVCLELESDVLAAENYDNVVGRLLPENTAYIIYTSGSTGQPKGVALEHKELVNYTYAILDRLQLPAGAAYATVSTIAADLGNTIIFASLCGGGVLHLISTERASDPRALADYFSRQPVDCLKIVPSHLAGLLAAAGTEQILPRQRLILGGESCGAKLAKILDQADRSCRIINHYGPTEAAIGVLTHHLSADDHDTRRASLPLSRPLENTQVYLLDPDFSPMPRWVPGQIYIGGDCLARGYLDEPQSTAQKFIPNPFSRKPGARLYGTGDLAWFLSSGGIEIAGRVDHQLKIRGFRVEIGEIEAALCRHPKVEAAAVMAREDGQNEKRLFAYVVLNQPEELPVNGLRAFLIESLPDYMVPSAFVVLKSLPLNPNGKLDRRALLLSRNIASGDEERQSRGLKPVQELLQTLWSQVLDVERVRLQDNFFELGGHSLHAMRLISRVREIFSSDLSIKSLFEAPTLTELAEVVESSMKDGHPSQEPELAPAPRAVNLPMAFAQQRLWFLEQLQPGASAYNIPLGVMLSGPLFIPLLDQCFQEVLRRHEILRTGFRDLNGQTVQVIRQRAELGIAIVDLSEIHPSERDDSARNQAARMMRSSFDLTQAPLLRAGLFRFDENTHLLFLTVHHIVFDAWSREILLREVQTLYRDFSDGMLSTLPELKIQYADFARWQAIWMETEGATRQLAHWKERLLGAPAVFELPTYQKRPPYQTSRGAIQSLAVDRLLTDSLRSLSHCHSVTLLMAVLAAFKVLLHRYTGAGELVVGTPISNRNRVELETLIGLFLNLLTLRTKISPETKFDKFLEQVRQVALDAYTHQNLPFEKLVEELNPQRDLSRTPVFQVLFIFQTIAVAESPNLPGLTLTSWEPGVRSARHDITLSVVENKDGLILAFEYNTDLLAFDTVSRMLEHLRSLLQGIAASPQRSIGELPLLTESERHQLLAEWNRADDIYSNDACLHELIESQATLTPDSVAVIFEEEQLTYAELNRRSNQLANHLRKLGVALEGRVGILIERSLEMVVGLIGTLKAGGTYIPLDPAYPDQRVTYILDDAQAPVLLTQHSLLTKLVGVEGQVVCLDTDWRSIRHESEQPAAPAITPDNLAYIIYTSGSSGQPKGVQISHRAVVNFLESMSEHPGLSSEDVLLSVTTVSFDIAGLELFLPLTQGATVVIASQASVTDGERLSAQLLSCQATIMQGTPALWQVLLDSNWTGLPPLKILCGGEALPPDLARRLVNKGTSLWNLYGPTETTIWSTSGKLEPKDDLIPIGRAIKNTQLYLCDPGYQPAPLEVFGELYIGGTGLARGYFNKPALTAERFTPDPYNGLQGARLFRTGDIARYRSDGRLELAGRTDFQIKIRGYRIELGEIESVLNQHEAVKRAVVIAREDEPGEKQLVAYVVSTHPTAPHAADWRHYLRQRLPEYMIPSTIVTLDDLPQTPNGKLDRRALPMPERVRPELGVPLVLPRTPTERTLASIWAEVLGVERVGSFDNFFELGGHSLLATKIFSRIREQFGIELSLHRFFEQPTIAGLATAIAQRQVEQMNGGAIDQILTNLERLSDEEAQILLTRQLGQWSEVK